MPTSNAEIKKPHKKVVSGKKKIAISKPIIIALTITGGNIAKSGIPLNFISLKQYVKNAAASVARVPKTISIALNEPMFEIKQPIVRPGIAAGVKIGRIVKTSEMRS